jgi:methylthioribose-1-phosphate isomerase
VIALARRSSLRFILPAIAAAAALAMTLAAQDAQSASYKKCTLSQREQYPKGTKPKPTYNLTLKAQSTSCATAKRVMKAFHTCRSRADHQCTRKVLAHWACTGKEDSSTAQIFYASFTCTWGKRAVKSSYQQNT